jgi:hypothetical protein
MAPSQTIAERVRAATGKRGKPVFKQRTPVGVRELDAAESRLGLTFPGSYRDFILSCGAGDFKKGELRLFAPSEFYAFDLEGVPFTGYVAIATDEFGNYLAFNPRDPLVGGERPLYYTCHDPFGIGKVSGSFGAFLTALEERGFDYSGIVDEVPGFEEVDLPDQISLPKPRPWWKFW